MVTLTILFDDRTLDKKLIPGHGFSCLIEVGRTKVLFDTGGDAAKLMYNMGALGINPKSIDLVVISHNHWDHTSGLSSLLSINPRITVYPPNYAQKPLEISPNLWITGYVETMYKDQRIIEQALVINKGNNIVIVSGCSHPGIEVFVEIAKSMFKDEKVKALIGGWHMVDKKVKEVVDKLNKLKELNVESYIPCHCIGDKNLEVARKILGDKIIKCGTGLRITL
ncbi:MAG: MBL fold metallo-hydrolase [Ignisphaera sp.]|uniref:MBL fold metallo-hydrolase n=1 Tax=Ignisphaera aggregans TaxID=334771 RepID=A0A7C4JK39_9CREN